MYKLDVSGYLGGKLKGSSCFWTLCLIRAIEEVKVVYRR